MPTAMLLVLVSISACFFRPNYGTGATSDSRNSDLETYIVHVEPLETRMASQFEDIESYHRSFLPISTAAAEEPRLLHSYRSVISGFAARLSEEELQELRQKNGFISAQKERILRPQTTHSPVFLGLHPETGFWKQSNFGEGMIIGVLDTGVTPGHSSFFDGDMPPPPAKWKGKCEFNSSVCNNKLIGARSFTSATTSKGSRSEPPLDVSGHGTHTSSTAAGWFVRNASALGNAYGTAVGVAPYAHLAIYKVCAEECLESYIVAGLDAAIEDGVDVISISLIGSSIPFYQDNIAIGSYSAIQKGIFVSCAAGNDGPSPGTLSNEAPWVLTVGASGTDRNIRATAKLGNGEEFDGETLFQPKDSLPKLIPLIYPGLNSNLNSSLCGEGSLDGIDVKGKVVLCVRGGDITRTAKGQEVKKAGGAAMILMNQEIDGFSTLADAHALPAVHLSYASGLKIKSYINSCEKPLATIIFKGTSIGDPLAPVVTSFSSRGPNLASPGILKPDIIGPGVNILAAWPFPLDDSTDPKLAFYVGSGTSMSCPHLSGVAALLKSAHPSWSPAAIKSAIMTTADTLTLKGVPIVDETLQPADIFTIGAGHVNPSKANDPGLIYDIRPDDYIRYLCGLNYTDAQVSIIARSSISCSKTSKIPEAELNYPSFSVKLGNAQTYSRTVTNVADSSSIYTVMIVAPKGVDISVTPKKLHFSKLNQKIKYHVQFRRKNETIKSTDKFCQGYLEWRSTKHVVKNVISINFN